MGANKYTLLKALLSAFLLASSGLLAPAMANAEGEAPAAKKYNIEMEMVQAFQRQEHKVPFTAKQGKITLKQELVTDGNVSHVSLVDVASGETIGETSLEGYGQMDFQLPHDGAYEFYFSNYKDKMIDTEPLFRISIEANNLSIKDSAVPKMKLPHFESFTMWSEPTTLEVWSETQKVTVDLDGKLVDDFPADETGNIPLTIYPKELEDGIHYLDMIAEKDNGAGTGTMLRRTFIVDNVDAFKDVPKSHWAHRPVEIMQLLGILNGRSEGLFEPGQAVTREEFAKILAISIKLPVDNARSADRFTDVAKNAWSGPYIQAMTEAGLVEGEVCGQGLCFYPNRPISRAEATAMMARTGKVTGTGTLGEKNFDDVKNLPLWAYEGITKLSKAGWIDGYEDGLFHPNGTLTRAEAAKLLGKFRKI
jgi:hypothetical protein